MHHAIHVHYAKQTAHQETLLHACPPCHAYRLPHLSREDMAQISVIMSHTKAEAAKKAEEAVEAALHGANQPLSNIGQQYLKLRRKVGIWEPPSDLYQKYRLQHAEGHTRLGMDGGWKPCPAGFGPISHHVVARSCGPGEVAITQTQTCPYHACIPTQGALIHVLSSAADGSVLIIARA